jgi:hypothetical protein
MANEYVIRRGLVVTGSTDLSGSLTVRSLSAGSGNLVSLGANGVIANSGYSVNQSLNTSSTPSFAGLTVNGNTTVTGNLTVSGTTTFINTTDIFIKDKLVVIASGSTTSADADGGGLFISGAAASITWSNGNSRMEFNKPLGVLGAVSASSYVGSGASLVSLNADNLASGTVPLGRISGLTNTQLSGTAGITNANLANSSVTVNGTAISLGASGTVTANTTNALTISTGLSGTSFNGSSAVTITIDSTVATLTGGQTLTNKTLTSPTINTATIAGGTINNAVIGGSTPAAGTFTTLSANTSITSGGSIAATGAITSTSAASNLTGSFSGSFKGDGSALTGVAASFPTSGPGVINGTTQFYVSNTGASQYGVFATIASTLAGSGLITDGSSGVIRVNSGSLLPYFSGSTFSTVSGDITITTAGVASISSGVIVDADINASANIAVSKLAANTISGVTLGGTLSALTAGAGLASGGTFTGAAARTFTVDSGSMATYFRQDAYSNISGDITINSSGVSAIGSGKVTSTMILDGTIVNGDINASANIAVSKLAASTISGITLGNNLGTLTLGDGLSGTSYNGSTGVTAAVDSTVVRTSGDQSIAGTKTFSGNIVAIGDLLISGSSGTQKSIIDKQQIGPQSISTLTQVAAVSATNLDAVFFDYVIKQSTTDMRSGTVMVVTNGSTAEFTEISTLDIGNTSMVILTADVNAGNVRLLALSPTGTWTIRTLVRTI